MSSMQNSEQRERAVQVQLSEEEWDAICNRKWNSDEDEEKSALPPCCANISELRSAIIAIRTNGGDITNLLLENLKERWEWTCDTHDMTGSWAILRKFMGQTGLPWPERREDYMYPRQEK